ncbi:Phosphate ABC transporter, periplasmic phosphate-binding protein PstS [Staphylococcus aureus]|nr:Phosphate ABC transporter, periplasmic phosphate-binding protein PstS [Staphylococcus aureus]
MKKWQFVGTTALGATLLLGACGGGNGGSGNSDLKGEAKGDGSSTVAPIVEKLNEKWAQDHSDAKISAGQAGTGAGFQNSLQEISTSLMLLDQLKMKRSKNYKIRISNTKNLKLRKIVVRCG